MSVAKNIEITSSSTVSFDDAVKTGISMASETVENIRSAWVKEMKVEVENGEVIEYRATMIVTFVISRDE